MEFRGYKITYNCDDWHQVQLIGDFWDFMAQFVPRDHLVGLGWNWNDQEHCFDYALGFIDDIPSLDKISHINLAKTEFHPSFCTVQLPSNNWKTFSGHIDDLQKIYEEQIDPLGEKDYELEYIDDLGNLQIKIHFK